MPDDARPEPEVADRDLLRAGPYATNRSRDERANARMTDWLEGRQRDLEALVGRTVARWDCVEMALRETSPDGPVFTDPAVSFLQLCWLRLRADTREVTVGIYQDDGYFGLCTIEGRDPYGPAPEDRGIYRWRELDLPTGRVDSVAFDHEEGELSRVTLTIDSRPLLLVAGEVYETPTDGLEVHRLDESVLVFLDPVDADRIDWV